MKKTLLAVLGTIALCGCVAHETNLQRAQAQRDELLLQKRMREGCALMRDQDAYRECLLKTYYATHPKGYETAELVDGEPLAIISNPKQPSCMQTQTQNTMRQVAPLPPISGPQILPYTTSEVTTTDSTYMQNVVIPQATVVKTQEVVATMPMEQPAPVVDAMPVVQPAPTPAVMPVAEPVEPDPQPTWWDTYQENRPVPVATQPKCPCDDPNDPCPQCYEK